MAARERTRGPDAAAQTDRFRRDRGMSLLEVMVVVGLMGLIGTVVVGAITVVFRTHQGVTNTTAVSHDVQQAVSFVHQDVQSGPRDIDSYRATTGAPGTRGSGCDDAGDENVLRFDTSDRRIAYRLVVDGDGAMLDRHVCARSGSSWEEQSVVNIADALDASDGAPAVAEVVPSTDDPTAVGRVVMSLTPVLGEVQELSAAPRAEEIADAPVASVGTCTQDPLAAAENFQTFIEFDAHLDGTQVKHSLGVGGSLSFDGNVSVGQNINQQSQRPETQGLEQAGLFVHRVDWSSTGANAGLTVHAGGDAAIEDASNVEVAAQGQNFTVYESGDSNGRPDIKVQNGGQVLLDDTWVDFDAAFAELRSCSDRLAALPADCSCADHVGLTNVNGDTYEGTAANSSVKLVLAPGRVNAFNVPEANMADLVDVKWASQFPSASSPLIINVASGPDLTFTPPQLQGAGSTASYVVWNFPNVTGTLSIAGGGGDGVWGTVFAPYAHVTASSKIEGGVIARSFDFTGSSINPSRSFEGVVPWDS